MRAKQFGCRSCGCGWCETQVASADGLLFLWMWLVVVLPASGQVVLWTWVDVDCEVVPASGQGVQLMWCQGEQEWRYLSVGSSGGETQRGEWHRGASLGGG